MYYFASDVHLGAGDELTSRRTEQRFVAWLDTVAKDAEEIFLVGDIFDFWFEYNYVIPKGFVRALGKLAELADRGVKITFITGNHDMWAKDYLERECGIKTFFTPQTVELAGKRLFVAHGDNMNIKNQPVLRLMNATFRSRIARVLFSWLVHPDLALKFGKWWSGSSRKSHGAAPAPEVANKSLVEYATQHPHASEIDLFIFGHTHAAAEYKSPHSLIYFLGEWIGSDTPTYGVLDNEGNFSLKQFKD